MIGDNSKFNNTKRTLAYKTENNQKRAIKANGIEIVLKIMNMHINDADVYASGFNSLIPLNIDNRKLLLLINIYFCYTQQKPEEGQEKTVKMGGIETALNGLRRHINSIFICIHGCCILGNMINWNGKQLAINYSRHM